VSEWACVWCVCVCVCVCVCALASPFSAQLRSNNGVRIPPGLIVLTVMLCGAYSIAMVRVRAIIPPFDAEYAPTPHCDCKPCTATRWPGRVTRVAACQQLCSLAHKTERSDQWLRDKHEHTLVVNGSATLQKWRFCSKIKTNQIHRLCTQTP
jgi:hypothetical protein